ncbi:unnamed protein product [Kuraishia capsulata CBS 1993]|uniref:Uncharacterized protein n=1 Tax=Kuraishia capsulata CBS 1993 TaxID=1382522 RepID=W6MU42_9ASCO|nr:uncharacterized protein KUCA_T00001390001 [Kuraishia capsulata CBS 1993]CDK25420.1 unnamed protein product [Kuraishia capsulata CBS 1993]
MNERLNKTQFQFQDEQQPMMAEITGKKRRGRLPKKVIEGTQIRMNQLPMASFNITSSASMNSAAALRNGAPNTLSPVMKVSPERSRGRRPSMASTATASSRSNSARSTPQSAARTETKTSPITPTVMASKTHAKLATVLNSLTPTIPNRDLSVVYEGRDEERTPGLLLPLQLQPPQLTHQNGYLHVDPSMLLPSPMVKKRKTSFHSPSIHQQHHPGSAQSTQSSETTYMETLASSPYYSPLTPTSHFSNVIRSSPMYNAYYNLPTTPVMRRNFDEMNVGGVHGHGDVVQLSVKPIKFEDIIKTPRGGVKIRESFHSNDPNMLITPLRADTQTQKQTTQPQILPQQQYHHHLQVHQTKALQADSQQRRRSSKPMLPVRLSLEVDSSGKAIIKRKSKSFSWTLHPQRKHHHHVRNASTRSDGFLQSPKVLKLGSDPVLTTVASMEIDDYNSSKSLKEYVQSTVAEGNMESMTGFGEAVSDEEDDICDARSALIDALA